jgi:hypothetical protein
MNWLERCLFADLEQRASDQSMQHFSYVTYVVVHYLEMLVPCDNPNRCLAKIILLLVNYLSLSCQGVVVSQIKCNVTMGQSISDTKRSLDRCLLPLNTSLELTTLA